MIQQFILMAPQGGAQGGKLRSFAGAVETFARCEIVGDVDDGSGGVGKVDGRPTVWQQAGGALDNHDIAGEASDVEGELAGGSHSGGILDDQR